MDIKPLQTDPKAESLITYPCAFPIKIMGVNQEGFTEAMIELLQAHDPKFDACTIQPRASKQGNYMALGVVFHATNREQLDNVYRALTSHAMVKVVL